MPRDDADSRDGWEWRGRRGHGDGTAASRTRRAAARATRARRRAAVAGWCHPSTRGHRRPRLDRRSSGRMRRGASRRRNRGGVATEGDVPACQRRRDGEHRGRGAARGSAALRVRLVTRRAGGGVGLSPLQACGGANRRRVHRRVDHLSAGERLRSGRRTDLGDAAARARGEPDRAEGRLGRSDLPADLVGGSRRRAGDGRGARRSRWQGARARGR
jgi:hypothetical protein